MNKKILHVVPTLKKDGAETQLLILLKELNKTELDLHLITFDYFSEGKSIKKDLDELGINITEFKKNILSTFFHLYNILIQFFFLSFQMEKKHHLFSIFLNKVENQFLFWIDI